ncbi:MAG: hypothetical protein H7Y27_10245 [Gemmatimonadaceae bacterium]|nr:hypothetical protein [Chitinophagaceae bacterium]
MKRVTSTITAILFFSSLVTLSANAQDGLVANSRSPMDKKGQMQETTTLAADRSANPLVISKFTNLFPAAADQHWTMIGGCSQVSFLNGGRKTSACFNEKGKLTYSITDCTMEQVPESFRKTISKSYGAYKVIRAVEVNAYGMVGYQVVLESDNDFKTIRYTVDGAEEIQQMDKAVN